MRLTYGDVDFNGSRICVGKARTKGRTAGQRWLPVPGGMPDQVAALVPLEDRERDRRVFPGLTDALVRKDLYRACRDAGVAACSPHDLRHRRISLWVAQGFDAVTVKTSTAERFPGVVSVWSEPTEVTRNRAA